MKVKNITRYTIQGVLSLHLKDFYKHKDYMICKIK